MSNLDRGRAESMLTTIAGDVRKHYYDSEFRGVDWDAKVQEAKDKIKADNALNMSLAHIAQALLSLNDSHTFFLPPPRPFHHDYGFQEEMIGDRCYIIRVRPESDAESKGVKPGDQVLSIDGFAPDRESLWKMDYRYNILRPEPGLRLVLRSPDGQERQVDVMAKIKQLRKVEDYTGNGIWNLIRQSETDEHLRRARIEERGDQLMILKLPDFVFDPEMASGWIGKARKHDALILDLRGNPGGSVDSLKALLGYFFEDSVKIADRKARKDRKPESTRGGGKNAYAGKLAVLVDSGSASAAELFARVVQLEKRGTVMGDHSSGSVMEAKEYSYSLGEGTIVAYGASITESDLIMSDGKSLEHTGVTPDEVLLPTGADLAAGRDPVLAHAAAAGGVNLSPEEAGKLFPYEWPKE